MMLVAAASLRMVPPAQAADQVVTDCADNGGAEQLRAKVAAAQSTGGGTITFVCGPATIVLQTNTPLPSITADTTVEGGGTITVSGNNPPGGSSGTRIFNVNAGATLTLNNITIRDGYANADGGAVRNDGTLSVNSSKFLYNATSANASGSAILSLGPLNITDTEFANNTGGGGAVKPRSANAVTTISGSSFHDNKSTASAGGGYGGAMQLHDAPSVSVDNCDFSNNEAGTSGGAIQVGSASALTLTESTVTANRALKKTGGGVDVAGKAEIAGTEITSNTALAGGGGISSEAGAQLKIVNSTIASNTVYDYKSPDANTVTKALGGGIRSLGALTVSGSTIRDNKGNVAINGSRGAGIYHENGALSLTDVTIQGNNSIHGAGIWMESGDATMDQVTFTGNLASSGDGGGLRVGSGTVSIKDSTFSGNYAIYSGGGITNVGTLTVTNSSFTDNGSYIGGGALMNYGTATLNNSTISGNTTSGAGEGFGGGINNRGTVTLNGTTVAENVAHYDGGGIWNAGTLNLYSSTVRDNTTEGGDEVGDKPLGGAGIFTSASANLDRSTVSGNKTTSGDGGGMYNSKGIAFVSNSTFSGNIATGWGGGIISNHAQTILNHVTLAGNSAAAGGGIYNLTADSTRTIVLSSTLIANSPSGYNCAQFAGSQDVQSYGYNLSDDDSFNTFCLTQHQPGDVDNAAAKLAPLADNGGETLTHLPQPGSAATDAIPSGINGCGTMVNPDQRGVSRPEGPGCDVGSVEVREIDYATPTPTPTPTATPTPTPLPPQPQLANISTRLRVETGDNVLIGGFIVTGTAPKRVLLRAIGPSLPVGDALADPFLELHDGSGATIFTNDNWKDTQQIDIEATTIPPDNELESAIVATLPANSERYTAIVRGVNDSAGVGLIEVYDMDRTVDSRLANISTRGLVQTSDNVMIGGFIVLGDNALRVIVRAIGPSLPVASALADPKLETYDGNGTLLAANDNWRSDQEAEIIATTVPPSNDLESAIVGPATPGNYTAIVRGVNDTTGVALVEVYALN